MAITLHASTTQHDRWGGPRRYIRVYVYDTTPELQRAAAGYRNEYDGFSAAGGCFHPAEVKDDEDPHWAGVLRLSREYIGTEVVSHECIHAAAAIYRMDVQGYIVLGYGCGHREETLAHIAGDLIASVGNALHESGVW